MNAIMQLDMSQFRQQTWGNAAILQQNNLPIGCTQQI